MCFTFSTDEHQVGRFGVLWHLWGTARTLKLRSCSFVDRLSSFLPVVTESVVCSGLCGTRLWPTSACLKIYLHRLHTGINNHKICGCTWLNKNQITNYTTYFSENLYVLHLGGKTRKFGFNVVNFHSQWLTPNLTSRPPHTHRHFLFIINNIR